MTHEDQTKYATAEFWEDRFGCMSRSAVEWYASYDELQEILHHVTGEIPELGHRDASVLVVGCGNSDLSYRLRHSEKYDSVTSMDISETVIKLMEKRYPNMTFISGDIRRQDFLGDDGSGFDFIIDKGTLDALLCGSEEDGVAMLSSISARMKDTSTLIVVSNRADRVELIERLEGLLVKQIWRCDLSDQAILVNVLRNSDDVTVGHGLMDKLMSQDVLPGCAAEVRESVSRKKCARLLRDMMRRRGNLEASRRSIMLYDSDRGCHERLPEPSSRTNYCFVYVIRNRS
jgi:hypothetical protein